MTTQAKQYRSVEMLFLISSGFEALARRVHVAGRQLHARLDHRYAARRAARELDHARDHEFFDVGRAGFEVPFTAYAQIQRHWARRTKDLPRPVSRTSGANRAL